MSVQPGEPHAVHEVVRALEAALADRWNVPVLRACVPCVPALLRDLATSCGPVDVLLSAPGIYRQPDVVDQQGDEPDQLDLWRIRVGGEPLGVLDLMEMIDLTVTAVLSRHRWTAHPGARPHTIAGRRLEVQPIDRGTDASPIKIGECGLAHPAVLRDAGLPPDTSGLAMDLGLARLTMLAREQNGRPCPAPARSRALAVTASSLDSQNTWARPRDLAW